MKRLLRLRPKSIFTLYKCQGKDIPVLNSSNADKAIKCLLVYNKNYMNYSTSSVCMEKSFGVFASLLRQNQSSSQTIGTLKYSIEELLKELNKREKTRVSKNDLNGIARTINGFKIKVFYGCLKNQKKDYKLVDGLLKAGKKRYLSIISKFCFHLACATFNSDCGYSKYDGVVSSNLYFYLNNYSTYKMIIPSSFNNKTIDTYKDYCDAIDFLCKQSKISRNDIDQIIWLYFR